MRRVRRRQRAGRVLDAPGLDANGVHRAADSGARVRRPDAPAASSWPSLGQHRGTRGGVLERRRDGDLLRALGRAHEHPHVPTTGVVGRREHPEAAALPRAQAGGSGEGHLRARHRQQQRDGQQTRAIAVRSRDPARSTSGVNSARPPDSRRHLACSTSCRTACTPRRRRVTLLQPAGSVVMIAPAGGATTW